MLTPIGLDVHCVPGNHDVPELMSAALSQAPFHYCAATEVGRWLIIGIDSYESDTPGGHVGDAELARLAREIEQSDAEHVLVCLHHPPVPMGSRWLDRVGLRNGSAVLERLADSVVAVLG